MLLTPQERHDVEGYLVWRKESGFLEKRLALQTSLLREVKLQTLFWEATRKSDINCIYSRIDKTTWNPKEELRTEEVQQIFTELAEDLGSGFSVGITGGEPLLRGYITEIVHTIKRLGFSLSLNSNGFSLGQNPQQINQLVQAGGSPFFFPFFWGGKKPKHHFLYKKS